MTRDDPRDWMWSEAIAMLTRAEHLHRRLFQPCEVTKQVVWEPPVDVLEQEREVLVLVALPGVDPDQVVITLEDGNLVVAGRRVPPLELRTAIIHRLELPQGRFERRVPLPPGRYDGARTKVENGCLVISLHKAA